MQETSTGLAFLYLIRSICKMELQDHIRELYFSDEFWGFYNKQQKKVKCKFNYVLGILRTLKKSAKEYKKQIEVAEKILGEYIHDTF